MVEYGLLDYSSGKVWPTEDFYFTVNLYDITNTVTKCIANLPNNCRKVNVIFQKGYATFPEFWEVITRKNIEIVWLNEDLTIKK